MIKDRLKQFLSYLGLSEGKFEAKVGVSKGFVSNVKGGISTNTLNKIKAAYPELNTAWLLTGAGEMVTGEVTESQFIAMAESTVAQLEKEIKLLYKLNDKLEKENARLEAELAEIKKAR